MNKSLLLSLADEMLDINKGDYELFLCVTGLALWRDTVVYGYNSPLRSLKDLVFGE